ncbi:hypothetical protein Ddye_005168 [Dipteronia dyeriana]|uniref:Transposase n=1 Tax=Dipteronia dyeriana TaxID=168575 RepID=A0AAD9XFM0_9ROSI|nr:hypothetical protein Ddye_005168 [Dipteronia dyeriana]
MLSALAEMLILDELPFRFVENRGFRKFCFELCPLFDLPSRRTIVRELYQLYIDEKIKVKKYFNRSKVRVCLTTDTWTSIQNINYMVVTAHFIDYDWQLQKRILSFSQIVDHKGDSIGKCIENVLIEWGIDKVFTITVDNATANTNCHWWNSTYLMLESAVKLRKAFERLGEEDIQYVNYFRDDENDHKRIGSPNFDDWDNAKVFINFLAIFYDITLDFSASLHVTSNIYFKSWCTIRNQLNLLITERDPLVSKIALSMQQKVDKFYGSLGRGAKQTDDVFSFGVGGGPNDDLEFNRLKAADQKDSLCGMKQQEEDIKVRWFPILSMVARDVFAMPVSTVASESTFSTGGLILDPFRSSLTPKIVEGLILIGNWLQTTCPIAEPRVVQEHAQNQDESVHLLEHYINIETEYESGVTNVSMEIKIKKND